MKKRNGGGERRNLAVVTHRSVAPRTRQGLCPAHSVPLCKLKVRRIDQISAQRTSHGSGDQPAAFIQ